MTTLAAERMDADAALQAFAPEWHALYRGASDATAFEPRIPFGKFDVRASMDAYLALYQQLASVMA